MIINLKKEAAITDVPTIVDFLSRMRDEFKELQFDKQTVTESVSKSLEDNVHWFLFYDEKNIANPK